MGRFQAQNAAEAVIGKALETASVWISFRTRLYSALVVMPDGAMAIMMMFGEERGLHESRAVTRRDNGVR